MNTQKCQGKYVTGEIDIDEFVSLCKNELVTNQTIFACRN